jgi:hypothetical protein
MCDCAKCNWVPESKPQPRMQDPFTYLPYDEPRAWRKLQPGKPIRIAVSTPNGPANKFAQLMVDEDYQCYRELPEVGNIEWIDDSEFSEVDILEAVKEMRAALLRWWEGKK